MKVQIIGGGAVGLLVASFFAQAKFDITLVVRNAQQQEAIQQNGIERNTLNGNIVQANITVVTQIQKDIDMTIVATKSYQLDDVFVQLRKLPQDMPVLFMQNGLAHYEPALLLPQCHIAYASVQFGAKKESASAVSHKGSGVVKIAVAKGEQQHFKVLQRVSSDEFPIEFVMDAFEMLFEKALLNCFVNPLTSILQVQNGRLIENAAAYVLIQQLYAELMDAFPTYKERFPFQAVCLLCEKTANNTSSMLADRLNGRKSEIDAIVLPVIQKAEQVNKMLPTLRTLYHLVIATEKEREKK